jgi:hypothetical protein
MQRDLKGEYESNARQLAEMVNDQRAHMTEVPSCGAEPMCISPAQMIGLAATAKVYPSYPTSLLLTAVGEMRQLQDKVAELEHKLAAAEAELTMWQDASDCIGPVGTPTD